MRSSAVGLVFLVGCASAHTKEGRPPEALDAGAPRLSQAAVGTGDDLGGDADFRDLAHQARTADPATARARLESFLLRHPHHHQRPAAVAMLTSVLLAMGDAASAKAFLVDNASFVPAVARDFLLGLCEGGLGNHSQALALLRPYLATDPPPMTALQDVDNRARLRVTLADALAASGDPAGAIDQLELYAQIEPTVEVGRAFAFRQAEAIAAKTREASAVQALSARHGALARAMLGPRAALALQARGDGPGAARLDQETMAIRKQLGMEVDRPWAVVPDPLRLGLVIPLSGAQARLGEVVLRGAMLVVTTAPGAVAPPMPFRLLLRDAAALPDRSSQGGGAGAGIADLARQEKVIGAVSTPDARGVELARGDGLPLLLLDERATGAGSTAFPILHSSEVRAAALARAALSLGARRFAVLGPDNAAGKRLAAAYKRAVEAGGGAVTGQITYAPTATSFSAEIVSLRKLAFDALFVPDDASRLELIAPALAVADIWPRSPRQTYSAAREASAAGPGRREALLLSTALGLSGKFIRSVERYVQGALFCPGFYPSEDMRSASFVTRFRETYGAEPSATDAYGYDAVSVLRGAVERGARTRADVVRILSTQTFEGLTGDVRFGPNHNRVDAPLVYVVDGDSIRIWQ
jgi:ABC-type branched-subunit amino acid transport system substrate-binding protein